MPPLHTHTHTPRQIGLRTSDSPDKLGRKGDGGDSTISDVRKFEKVLWACLYIGEKKITQYFNYLVRFKKQILSK